MHFYLLLANCDRAKLMEMFRAKIIAACCENYLEARSPRRGICQLLPTLGKMINMTMRVELQL